MLLAPLIAFGVLVSPNHCAIYLRDGIVGFTHRRRNLSHRRRDHGGGKLSTIDQSQNFIARRFAQDVFNTTRQVRSSRQWRWSRFSLMYLNKLRTREGNDARRNSASSWRLVRSATSRKIYRPSRPL